MSQVVPPPWRGSMQVGGGNAAPRLTSSQPRLVEAKEYEVSGEDITPCPASPAEMGVMLRGEGEMARGEDRRSAIEVSR
jgi:hypothetical protein